MAVPTAEQLRDVNPNITDEEIEFIEGVSEQNQVEAISPSDLEPVPGFALPTPAFPTATSSLSSLIASLTEQSASAFETLSGSQAELAKTFEDIVGVTESRATLEKQEDIAGKQEALDEITSEIELKQRALLKEIEELEKNESGLFGGALEDAIADAEREGNRELADLAIIQGVALRDLSTAQALVDRKIELALEPLALKLDFQREFFNLNQSLFTQAEARAFSALLTFEERAFAEEQADLQTLETTKLDLLSQAVANNAPTSVLKSIQAATTPEDAIIAAGSFGQKSTGGGGLVQFSPEDERTLAGVGFDNEEIQQIEDWLNDGISAESIIETNNLWGTKANAIRKVANQPEVDIVEPLTDEEVDSFAQDLFDEAKSDFLGGFFQSEEEQRKKAKEAARELNLPEEEIEKIVEAIDEL